MHIQRLQLAYLSGGARQPFRNHTPCAKCRLTSDDRSWGTIFARPETSSRRSWIAFGSKRSLEFRSRWYSELPGDATAVDCASECCMDTTFTPTYPEDVKHCPYEGTTTTSTTTTTTLQAPGMYFRVLGGLSRAGPGQNFLWHRHPEMLRSNGQEPLSSRLMRSGLEVPADWFSKPPGVVPLFNPSLLSLEDGSILAVMRMSNGPGCPSLRVSRESCMDTRIFHNALVLAQLDSNLTVQSHVVVDVPELTCRFTPDVEVSGRRFLDEVHGPMDARIGKGADGEMWIFFYAERNGENNEALRGMHAAPLRVSWRACGVPGWTFHRNGAFSSEDCPWKGSGDSRSIQACRNSCDAAGDCNAVSYKPEDPGSSLGGSCELRYCQEGLAQGTKKSPAVLEMPKWQAWLRRPQVQRWRRSPACTGGWLGNGDATNLKSCKQSCEDLGACNAILFSSGIRLCVLQPCGEPSKDAAEGWEAWRLEAAEGKKCLESAQLQANELLVFPSASGVEKNWNLIHGDRDRLYIEYFIEPHIVIEAKLQRADGLPGLQLASFEERFVSRWPFEVLHGVTNVRGGFCCLSLPSAMREHVASDAVWATEDPETLPSLPEGNLLLGAGHLQRIRQPFDQAPGDVSRFRRQAKSRTYHQFFYLLRAMEPFDVVAVSPEWCITINGRFSQHWSQVLQPGEEACESIQFVSGLTLRGDEVVVAYGINDCESDLLVIPAATVLGMLRPVESNLNVSLDDIEML
eukprot:s1322_g4.t2